jgi:hypothetical protein
LPNFPQGVFPTIEDVMNLARSIVNDTFPGLTNTPGEGRILTDSAPFTLPYLNSAFATLQRKLRLEGVTFPIKDNVILFNLTPIVSEDPNVQVFVGYNGYFDGTSMHASPVLPSDFLQPLDVEEQTVGTNTPFTPMTRFQGGFPSMIQGNWLTFWDWRTYAIYMPGSNQTKNIRLRYTSGQPPLNVPPASFPSTHINIIDSTEALAHMVAAKYAMARGGASEDVKALVAQADDIISDMAQEYIRAGQSVVYRREQYSNASGANTVLGSTGQNN